ncbi:hypothetical protein AGMMS49991_04550 [Spirochaetia bacterium]|nr:hypothetical protein AGMMS49991_04550 [Spirochaetia bacterium]
MIPALAESRANGFTLNIRIFHFSFNALKITSPYGGKAGAPSKIAPQDTRGGLIRGGGRGEASPANCLAGRERVAVLFSGCHVPDWI